MILIQVLDSYSEEESGLYFHDGSKYSEEKVVEMVEEEFRLALKESSGDPWDDDPREKIDENLEAVGIKRIYTTDAYIKTQ